MGGSLACSGRPFPREPPSTSHSRTRARRSAARTGLVSGLRGRRDYLLPPPGLDRGGLGTACGGLALFSPERLALSDRAGRRVSLAARDVGHLHGFDSLVGSCVAAGRTPASLGLQLP